MTVFRFKKNGGTLYFYTQCLLRKKVFAYFDMNPCIFLQGRWRHTHTTFKQNEIDVKFDFFSLNKIKVCDIFIVIYVWLLF